MSELLVLAKGDRLGDIIVVRPDGWVWGKEESLPSFWVVKVKEKDVSYLEQSDTVRQEVTKQVEYPIREFVEKKREVRMRNLSLSKNVLNKNLLSSISTPAVLSEKIVDGKKIITTEETTTETTVRNPSRYRINKTILDTFKDTMQDLSKMDLASIIEDKSGNAA
jgi:hypothetical protein